MISVMNAIKRFFGFDVKVKRCIQCDGTGIMCTIHRGKIYSKDCIFCDGTGVIENE